jgi:hypothetical protein
MTKLTRALQKIFCGGVPATNNVAVFGSLKAAAPAYSQDPALIQSLPAYSAGWSGATILNQAPALQDMNALQFLFSRQLSYIFQSGIPEYLDSETYYTASIVRSGPVIYASLIDANIGQALTDNTKWQVLLSNKFTSISGAYTIINNDFLIKASGSSSYAVTLPKAVTGNIGEQHVIKSVVDAGLLVTVQASGGSLIDGQATIVISSGSSICVVSDGTNWMII